MKGLSLAVKKEFAVSAEALFEALSRGALFIATGALPGTTAFEFKVGGEFRVEWIKSQYAHGKFTEIIPNEKIAFTWTGVSTIGKFNNTNVTVTLQRISENKTELRLRHEGFDDEAVRKDHETGWLESLANLKS